MANPDQSADAPQWRLDPNRGPEWESVFAILKNAQRAFVQIYSPSQEYPDAKQLQPFRSAFGKGTSSALADLYDSLSSAIFLEPEFVFTGDASEQRYLVQYLDVEKIKELRAATEQIFAGGLKGESSAAEIAIDFLLEWTEGVRQALIDVPRLGSEQFSFRVDSVSEKTALRRWSKRISSARKQFEAALEALAAVETAREAVAETISLRDQARLATGEAGASALGSYFTAVSDAEHKSSLRWTAGAIASAFGALIVGLTILFKKDGWDWAETLFHLALALPLIGIASYVARIAGHHRSLARWAKAAAVQVNTAPAFSQLLANDESREDLILRLGHNIFAAPNFDGPSESDKISAIPPEWIEAFREMSQRLPKNS